MMQQKIEFIALSTIALLMTASISESLQVSVITYPNAGPKYSAGDLVYFICLSTGGVEPYTYSWSVGCSFTNTMTQYALNSSVFAGAWIISGNCKNSYTCKVTDALGNVASDNAVIETVTDIAIVITSNKYNFLAANITILAANTSGRFHDIYCGSGLRQPNLGKWIHPNGNEITAFNQKYTIEKAGGIDSFPYIALSLTDGYSLSTSDYGLYRCKMLDIDRVEREKHIWILPEQEFEEPTPENFPSYSGTDSVTLYCRYSNTPGKIYWRDINQGIQLTRNDSLYHINQHLLQADSALYEGVLELKMVKDGLMRCSIINSILNSSSHALNENLIGKAHYFFLQFIGQQQGITCSFSHDDLLSVELLLDGQVLVSSTTSSYVSYTIPQVTDNLHNHEYDCVGTKSGGSKDYLSFTLVALIPDHALTVYVQQQPSEVTDAGQNVQLILSAIKAKGFTHDQSITCTNEIGNPLENINGISYPANPTHTGLTLQYIVPINPVKLSHAGLYMCTATLETAHQIDNITDHTNFNITVTIPVTPMVTLIGISNGKVGSIAEFNCSTSLTSSTMNTTMQANFLDVPIVPNVKWTVNGTEISSLQSHDRYYVSETASVDDVYYSVLNIVPLMKEDESTVTCTAQMTPSVPNQYIIDSQVGQASFVLSVEGPDVLGVKLIQIQLIGMQSQCSQWMVNINNHLESITNIIVDTIKDRCSCQYTTHYITDQQLTCSPTNGLTAVTYRAKLYETDTTEVNTIQGYLQEWVSSNPQIDIEPAVTLNTDCNVDISTFNDPQCEIRATITATADATVTPSNRPFGDSEGISMTHIIGGGVSVVLVVILVIIAAVSIGVCVMRRKKKVKQRDLRQEDNYCSVNARVNNIELCQQQSSLYPPPPPEAQPYQSPFAQSPHAHLPPDNVTMATTSTRSRTTPLPLPPPHHQRGPPRPVPGLERGPPRPVPGLDNSYRNYESDYDRWNHQRRNLPAPPPPVTYDTKPVGKYHQQQQHTKTVQYNSKNFYKNEEYVDMDHGNKYYNGVRHDDMYESMDNYQRP